MITPASRSLKYLREQGYTAQVVERWNAYAKVRVDLFGIIDIVAIHPKKKGVLGIQATSTTNISHRYKKAMENSALYIWLQAGNKFVIYGWSKKGKKGKRKLWELTKREVK